MTLPSYNACVYLQISDHVGCYSSPTGELPPLFNTKLMAHELTMM